MLINVIFHSPPSSNSRISEDFTIPLSRAARCLGAWWTPNLSCSHWIECNIKKARTAFFARGQGVFLGTLNPLSSRSIIECCVMPVLLYGCESWILNNSLLKKLESFQTELGKRILRLPKCTSNRVIRMALRWPSVRARVLCIKFNFLKKIGTKDDGLSSRVFRTLAVSDVESIHLVRQCRFLEATFHSNFTSDLITSPSITHIKKAIFSKDYSSLLAYGPHSLTGRVSQCCGYMFRRLLLSWSKPSYLF